MTRQALNKKLLPLAKEAATALVIAIEGDGKRDARIMRSLTATMLKFIRQAHSEGYTDGHLEGIEVGQDRHWS